MNTVGQPEEYDLVILGSGAGSKLLAWTFASRGQRVAAVERKYVGGACPNIACLPSKNIIHTAQIAHYVRNSEEFGITINGFTVKMPAVRERKRRMVQGLVDTHLDLYHQSGAELIMASGRFIGPRTLEATLSDGTKRVLRGKNVVIGTGTRAAMDNTPGMQEAKPLTNVEALELDVVPEHLIVLGGGYVGLEFAQAMRRFGSKVTVVDRNGHLLHREDGDITDGLQVLFEDEGIGLVLNAKVQGVSGTSGQSVRLSSGWPTTQPQSWRTGSMSTSAFCCKQPTYTRLTG
jgi:pyruvate/2-oxoglutarate dehydrogenase complex dihydrolipoamide dehydrogenase (E3) component